MNGKEVVSYEAVALTHECLRDALREVEGVRCAFLITRPEDWIRLEEDGACGSLYELDRLLVRARALLPTERHPQLCLVERRGVCRYPCNRNGSCDPACEHRPAIVMVHRLFIVDQTDKAVA